MKTFKLYLESIIDSKKENLSPSVFDKNEKLLPDVQKFLVRGAKQFPGVKDFYLLGSIITKRWTDTSDLDINILLDVTDEKLDALHKSLKSINEKPLPGTKHPVNYYLVNSKEKFDKLAEIADGVFDIKNNKFLREPVDSPFDIDRYMEAYRKRVKKISKTKEDLIDDIMDYQELKNIDEKSLKSLQSKLYDEIESNAVDLAKIYDDIIQNRKKSFELSIASAEVIKYGHHNRLPGNVVYKLLEKHSYLKLLKNISDIVGEDKKLSKPELQKLIAYLRKE